MVLEFTFQSGSIQMNLNEALEKAKYNLHSNLVLFKLRWDIQTETNNQHLHSNLVLFK